MSNPSNNNLDFHYTLVCSIADAITKLKIGAGEDLSKEWVDHLVNYVSQDECPLIQEVAIKAIKHII